MVTGDNPLTAVCIARQSGLIDEQSHEENTSFIIDVSETEDEVIVSSCGSTEVLTSTR